MRASKLVAITACVAMTGLIGSPADAGKASRRERIAKSSYQTPVPGVTPVHPTGVAICQHGGAIGESRGCMPFAVGANERFAMIEVTDASGLAVPAFWDQGENIDDWVPFCGSTPKPVRISPGVMRVWVYAYRSPNLPSCPGVGTTGSVTVTFSQ